MTDMHPAPDVLIVDDEPLLRDEVREFLGWHEINVTTASDGAEAISLLAENPAITVVLTDIRMPALDGISLAKRLMRSRGDADAVEVILMTGHANLENATQAVRAGVFDFLSKPMILEDMLRAVRRADAKARARRNAEAKRLEEMGGLRADYAALQARFAQAGGAPLHDTPPELGRILSHELRTPLIPILGLSVVLDEDAGLPAEALGPYLRDVHQAGERLLAIADDLVEFFAPPQPADLSWETVRSDQLLRRLRDAFETQAKEDGVHLVVEDATPTTFKSASRCVASALGRLVANAIAATPAGGTVILSATPAHPPQTTAPSPRDDCLAFSVRDQGKGMTAEQIAAAKRPFQQIDMSLSRRTGGLGLGLTLADRMAQRLGGWLSIESVPGQGTVASITLPRQHHVEPR